MLDLNPSLPPVHRLTVHRLAARTQIRSLESEERLSRGKKDEDVKKKVVELSVQSGVSSSFTAFIAVNKDNGESIQGNVVRRDVPTVSECFFVFFFVVVYFCSDVQISKE